MLPQRTREVFIKGSLALLMLSVAFACSEGSIVGTASPAQRPIAQLEAYRALQSHVAARLDALHHNPEGLHAYLEEWDIAGIGEPTEVQLRSILSPVDREAYYAEGDTSTVQDPDPNVFCVSGLTGIEASTGTLRYYTRNLLPCAPAYFVGMSADIGVSVDSGFAVPYTWGCDGNRYSCTTATTVPVSCSGHRTDIDSNALHVISWLLVTQTLPEQKHGACGAIAPPPPPPQPPPPTDGAGDPPPPTPTGEYVWPVPYEGSAPTTTCEKMEYHYLYSDGSVSDSWYAWQCDDGTSYPA